MDKRLADFYDIPNIKEYEDTCIQVLRENCTVLEEELRNLAGKLPDYERQVIEAYVDIRDELEFESIKTALRWGKRHYK